MRFVNVSMGMDIEVSMNNGRMDRWVCGCGYLGDPERKSKVLGEGGEEGKERRVKCEIDRIAYWVDALVCE